MARSDATTFFDVDLAVGFDIKGGGFTTQAFRHQFHLQLVVANFEDNFLKEQVKDLFSGVL
ncbi:hypothetical protein D3C73_1164960 [compost metagenome]